MKANSLINLAFAALLSLLPLVAPERPMRDHSVGVNKMVQTGGFTAYQVSLMSTDEKEVRFVACTNLGGYHASTPMPGWDSAIEGDTAYYYRIWLEGLLWPSEYPPNHPPHVCESFALAAEGAYNVGVGLLEEDTAATIVDRVLSTVGH